MEKGSSLVLFYPFVICSFAPTLTGQPFPSVEVSTILGEISPAYLLFR